MLIISTYQINVRKPVRHNNQMKKTEVIELQRHQQTFRRPNNNLGPKKLWRENLWMENSCLGHCCKKSLAGLINRTKTDRHHIYLLQCSNQKANIMIGRITF